jgi:hypothetical protein
VSLTKTDAEETGRRRCRIPEHRRQIRELQKQLRAQDAITRETATRAREWQRDVYVAHERLAQVAEAWGWVCRWLGHRPAVRYGEYCGRCGQAVPR